MHNAFIKQQAEIEQLANDLLIKAVQKLGYHIEHTAPDNYTTNCPSDILTQLQVAAQREAIKQITGV